MITDIKFHIETDGTVILNPNAIHLRHINRPVMISLKQKQRGKQTDSDNNDDKGGRRLEGSGDLDAADALLWRPGGKKVLDEGNDAFGGSRQKSRHIDSDNAESR